MPRFSLRDLFWLTLVVGMALGWWLDRHSLVRQVDWMRSVAREEFLILPFDGYGGAIHLAMFVALLAGLLYALNIHVRAAIETATRPRNDY